MGCDGGNKAEAFTVIKRKGGIDTEGSYPYEGKFVTPFWKSHA